MTSGCEIKIIGAKLIIEQAIIKLEDLVLVCLDLKNAHNAYKRSGAQECLDGAGPGLKTIAQAHRADTAHGGNVYMRNSKSKTGFIKIATSTAGGPQGSPLTNIAFPALINGPLKETKAKFPGVEIQAIQYDCDIYGLPDFVFGSLPDGSDGALHFLLERLADCNLQPKKDEF